MFGKVENDGTITLGQNHADIEEVLQILATDFNDHGIFFVWDCQINEIIVDPTTYEAPLYTDNTLVFSLILDEQNIKSGKLLISK